MQIPSGWESRYITTPDAPNALAQSEPKVLPAKFEPRVLESGVIEIPDKLHTEELVPVTVQSPSPDDFTKEQQ